MGFGIIELAIVLTAITGITVVLRDQMLNSTAKSVLIIAVLVFNFVGLILFIGWRFFYKKAV